MKKNEAEDIYRRVFESVSEGILIADSKGQIIEANPRLFKLFGYDQELIGKPINALIPERFHGSHKGHHSKYMAKPSQRSMGIGV